MIAYVLDSDILSLYQLGQIKVTRAIESRLPDELSITVINVEEQLTGWYRLLRRVKRPDQLALAYQSLADNVRFLAHFPILTYHERAMNRFDDLVALRLNVGKMDLRIAAIAIEEGCTVVTRNLRDFGRIPGLAVEDWSI